MSPDLPDRSEGALDAPASPIRPKVGECPVCCSPLRGKPFTAHFSKEGTWCNHKGWVLQTGATMDDPPILGSVEAPR